jgi:hypothetical protein
MGILETSALDRYRAARSFLDAKVAGPWQVEREGLEREPKTQKLIAKSEYTRRDVRGAVVASANVADDRARWSVGSEGEAAESLGDAFLEAESRLQAEGWEVLAPMVLRAG